MDLGPADAAASDAASVGDAGGAPSQACSVDSDCRASAPDGCNVCAAAARHLVCSFGQCTCACQVSPACNLGRDPLPCQAEADCAPSGATCAGNPGICRCRMSNCTPGQDQTCNADPQMSAPAGSCSPFGSCLCSFKYGKEPSGKCSAQACSAESVADFITTHDACNSDQDCQAVCELGASCIVVGVNRAAGPLFRALFSTCPFNACGIACFSSTCDPARHTCR
jgi:hypothetical protein